MAAHPLDWAAHHRFQVAGHPAAQAYPPQQIVWREQASPRVSQEMMNEVVAYSARRVLVRLSLLVVLVRTQELNAGLMGPQAYSWLAQQVSRLLEGLVTAQQSPWTWAVHSVQRVCHSTVVVLKRVQSLDMREGWLLVASVIQGQRAYNWPARRGLT